MTLAPEDWQSRFWLAEDDDGQTLVFDLQTEDEELAFAGTAEDADAYMEAAIGGRAA